MTTATTARFLPYARQSISEADKKAVMEALAGDFITRGPIVEQFEEAVASYCDAKYAVAFSSGSAALAAAFSVGQVSPGDRVITSPNTFVASVGPAVGMGATPTFVDIDPATGNIDLTLLEETLEQPQSRGKRVIVPVHFAGVPVDMQRLESLLSDPQDVVIEDAAHALGSSFADGQKVGCCAFSAMTIFSFHPAKTITTGEGGMVTTNDLNLLHRLHRYRNNGIERDSEQQAGPWYYEVHALTGNTNITDFQAQLGLSQLQRLQDFVEKRQQLMSRYSGLLRDIDHVKPLGKVVDTKVGYHLCVALIDFEKCGTDRTSVMSALREAGIGTQVHYIPLYRHPYFQKRFHVSPESFSNTEQYYEQALTLPLFYDMDLADVDTVCGALRTVLK